MRYFFALFTFLILLPAIALAEDRETLEFSRVRAWNEELAKLREYADNAFIFEEKLTEYAKTLETEIGAPIHMDLEVSSVQKTGVHAKVLADDTFEIVAPGSSPSPFPPRIPFAIVTEPTDKGVQVTFDSRYRLGSSDVSGRHDYGMPGIRLRIGDLVPLEKARTLRRGDQLTLKGKVDSIIVGQVSRSSRQYIAVLVIASPEITYKSKADDSTPEAND